MDLQTDRADGNGLSAATSAMKVMIRLELILRPCLRDRLPTTLRKYARLARSCMFADALRRTACLAPVNLRKDGNLAVCVWSVQHTRLRIC